jgi:hypothetical protein
MADWAAIIIIVAASLITGCLIVALFIEPVRRFDGDRLALVFSSLVAGIAVNGWLALVLAELGWYSIGLMVIIWFIVSVSLGLIVAWRRRSATRSEPLALEPRPKSPIPTLSFLPVWFEYAFLAMWLVIASWLFFRPHQYIIGGADAGVYINLAANISGTGSILIEDQTLADLDPSLYPALLRSLPERDSGTEVAPYYIFPGFYVTDAAQGKIMPQFYPLHPVWQAVAYGLGGVGSALFMTGLWALLGGLAIYMTIRELGGWEVAALGLTGLSLTALQVWFARYPTTEALTQFLLWAAVWSTILWFRGRQPRALWAMLAGVAYGEVLLVRIDTYFLLIIPVFAWFYLRWSGRWRKEDWWFFAPLGLLTAHSLIHARWQSTPYFYNTFSYGLNLVRRNWLIPVLAILFGAAILILYGRYRHTAAGFRRYRKPVLIAGVIAIVLLFIYGWFIRPSLGDIGASRDYWFAGGQIPTQLDRENLLRLGWYLSPLGIVLAMAGICLMLWKVTARTAVVLVVGLMFSLLYLWRIQANPHQIYTMRRYVPAVLPFFVVSTAYLLEWLMRQKRKWMVLSGMVLAILWLVGLAWSARGFISQVDYKGIIAQVEELDSRLEPGSILIFGDDNPITLGDLVGTPMQYIYGHKVYSLRDAEHTDIEALNDAVEAWVESGQSVYWVGDSGFLEFTGLTPRNSFTYTLTVPQLETSYENKPTRVIDIKWVLHISQLD